MPTWEAFIQKGKEVYEKSNGEVYMWFSLEDIRQFTQEQSDTAWVSDGKIDVKNVFDPVPYRLATPISVTSIFPTI